MKNLFFLLAAVLLSTTVYGQARNPMGEKAYYDLDKRRSHSMIKSGNFDSVVASYNPDAEGGPAYEVKLKYKFVIKFMGTQQGTELVEVPAEYFTPEFLEDLRDTGHYESEQFKVEHLGYADARTMNGKFYPDCDRIRIYDIKQKKAVPDFALAMIGFNRDLYGEEIEDLVIKAHISYGVPVLGAVKIDVSGKTRGRSVYAGADLR